MACLIEGLTVQRDAARADVVHGGGAGAEQLAVMSVVEALRRADGDAGLEHLAYGVGVDVAWPDGRVGDRVHFDDVVNVLDVLAEEDVEAGGEGLVADDFVAGKNLFARGDVDEVGGAASVMVFACCSADSSSVSLRAVPAR